MGLLIKATEEDLRVPKTFEPDDKCPVCQYRKKDSEKNDLEAIFGMLEDTRKSGGDLGEADKNMCDFHKKKAQGLKIFNTRDELFEMDGSSTKILNGVPDLNKVSEQDYNSKVEIEDGET